MRELLSTIEEWRSKGIQVVLASVVKTWGSSPRPVGSKLAVSEDGDFIGSVSGGCVEGAVIEAAAEVFESGEPKLLEFGVSDDQAWSVGLSCGGQIEVFVELVGPVSESVERGG